MRFVCLFYQIGRGGGRGGSGTCFSVCVFLFCHVVLFLATDGKQELSPLATHKVYGARHAHFDM